MKKQILKGIILIILVNISCQKNQPLLKPNNKIINHITVRKDNTIRKISFRMLENHFVKNTVTTLDNPKIESENEFNQIYGKATILGKEGQPTIIDFKKEFLIVVILPETYFQTAFGEIGVEKDKYNRLIISYKVQKGTKQTYSSRPSFAVIINKSEKGQIHIKEQ